VARSLLHAADAGSADNNNAASVASVASAGIPRLTDILLSVLLHPCPAPRLAAAWYHFVIEAYLFLVIREYLTEYNLGFFFQYHFYVISLIVHICQENNCLSRQSVKCGQHEMYAWFTAMYRTVDVR
jgi:hypothetical protein